VLATEPCRSGTATSKPMHAIDCRRPPKASDKMSIITQQVRVPHETIIYLVNVMHR